MTHYKTFLELLQSDEDLDCDLIIGNCDMPATLVWESEHKMKDAGIEYFKELMESPYLPLRNGNIEVLCDNQDLGEKFCWGAAGFVAESLYESWFDTDTADKDEVVE